MIKKSHASSNIQAETPFAGDQSQFLVKEQVAQRIQKSERTVELWTRRGILPCLKIGRSVLYSWPDIEKQLRDKFTVHASAPPKKTAISTAKKG